MKLALQIYLMVILSFATSTVKLSKTYDIPADCGARTIEEEWVRDDVTTTGLCRSFSVIQWVTTKTSSQTKTCSEKVHCPIGKYSNGKGSCNLTQEQCYHRDNCITPKHLALSGSCQRRDWEQQMNYICSMHETGVGCGREGYNIQLHWIIDSKGVKRYLERLSLTAYQKNLSSVYTNTRLPPTGPITGDDEYCHLRGLTDGCAKMHSDAGSTWRVQDPDQLGLQVTLDHCKEEIYCYGKEDVLIFPYQKDKIKVDCPNCKLTCESTAITLTIPDDTEKIIRLCGRQECWTEVTRENIHIVRRSFYHKIYDERLTAYITNTNRDISYELSADCPVSEICEAIDCEFCYVRWINIKCYSWFHTVLALLMFYLTFGSLSFAVVFIKPLVTLITMIVKFSYRFLRKMCSLLREGGSRVVNRLVEFTDGGRPNPPLAEQPRAHAGPLVGPRRVFITLVTLFGTAVAKAPCANIVVDTIRTETCKQVGSQLLCVISTLIDLPLVSYDQASCLHFIDDRHHILGELQVVPLDLSFRCDKREMYFTRDVRLVSDGITRCPHAGPCNDSWCASVDSSTVVEGLSDIQWPFEQSCRASPACASQGCFFCTNACGVSRYYPKPMSPIIYQVFDCLKWEPSGLFRFEWFGTTQDMGININLAHGETKDVNSEIKATLEFTVQSQTPALTKTFITDGHRVAVTSASDSGIPIPGTIGQVQCGSSSIAAIFDKRCTMAPNACICQLAGACDCSQVYLEKVFNSQNSLPLTIGNDYLTSTQGIPSLKTSAFGSAKIKIQAVGRVAASTKKVEECHIEIKGLDGCHSCLIGATVNYTCRSMSEVVIILRCGVATNLQIECDASNKIRSTRLQYTYPLVDLACTTACSKTDVALEGSLKAVGLQHVSGASHIQLMPAESLMDYGSWLTGAWFSLGWLNTFWMAGVMIALLVSANCLYMIMRSKVKTN